MSTHVRSSIYSLSFTERVIMRLLHTHTVENQISDHKSDEDRRYFISAPL